MIRLLKRYQNMSPANTAIFGAIAHLLVSRNFYFFLYLYLYIYLYNYNIHVTNYTKIGRMSTFRINLGSSKRTICLHLDREQGNDDKDNNPTNIEVYEYCVGSIRQNLLLIQNTHYYHQK